MSIALIFVGAVMLTTTILGIIEIIKYAKGKKYE